MIVTYGFYFQCPSRLTRCRSLITFERPVMGEMFTRQADPLGPVCMLAAHYELHHRLPARAATAAAWRDAIPLVFGGS